MLRLGPGWLCQPKFPPGATRLSVVMTSVSPFVRRLSFQSPVLRLTSTGGRLPTPIVVLVTPLAGVARVTPANAATPSTATSRARLSRFDIGKISFGHWWSRVSADELRPLCERTRTSSARLPCLPAHGRGCWHPAGEGCSGPGLFRPSRPRASETEPAGARPGQASGSWRCRPRSARAGALPSPAYSRPVPIRLVLAEDHYLVREGVRRLLEAQPELEVAAVCGDLDSL